MDRSATRAAAGLQSHLSRLGIRFPGMESLAIQGLRRIQCHASIALPAQMSRTALMQDAPTEPRKDSETSWQARAAELAEALQRQRTHWSSSQQELTHTLLLITKALTGFDSSLDNELREFARRLQETGNPATLCDEMQNLAQCFLPLLEQARKSGELPDNNASLLVKLLEHMPLPPEFEPRRQALRANLLSGSSPDPVRDASSLLSEVHLFLRKDTRVLDDFLKRASQYLGNLDSQLRFAMDNSRAGATDSDALSAEIQTSLQELGSVLAVPPHADVARHPQLEAHVVALQSSFGDLFELQRKQRAEYEQRIAELTKQVASFETESAQLRENLAAEHARAYRDALTDVPNRLAYQERGEMEIRRHRRSGRPLCLAVLDLDRFKDVNDRYGHRVGDKLLRSVANIAADRFRSTDTFARYGGEEFVVLLPETSQEDALRLCEDFRERIATAAFQTQGEVIPVTISIGLARHSDGETLEGLFERADSALYKAKAAGRNCIVVAS